MFEDPDANPFLPGFYQDPSRHALPVQLFFLFQRSNQVRDLAQSDLFRGVTVADFMLEKDPLFAQMNLNDAELALVRNRQAGLSYSVDLMKSLGGGWVPDAATARR